MRQSIAYIISAVIHVAALTSLLPSNTSKEETVIGLPEQLTIDLQMQASLPKPEKPVVRRTDTKTVKSVSTTKTSKIIDKTELVEPPTPESVINESKIDPKTIAKDSTLTSEVETNKQKNIVPIANTKQKVKDENEFLIIHNPTYQSQRPIKYPKRAKRKKLQGTVIIRANIDLGGRVKKAWIHQSSGYSILDRSAIKSVQGWIFKPAQRGDLTLESTVQFPVVFRLK